MNKLRQKVCPKCGEQMVLRLGDYECASCDYVEPAPPEQTEQETTPQTGPGFKQPGPAGAPIVVPPPTAYPRIGLKEPSDTPRPGSLSQEKLLFVTVYFFLQLGTALVFHLRHAGALGAMHSLPGMIVSAVLASLCAGFVLYYDHDCLRQTCLGCSSLIVISLIASIVMAIFASQTQFITPMIPNLVIHGWLVSILWRDRRSEEF
jgi:hypothetical protein